MQLHVSGFQINERYEKVGRSEYAFAYQIYTGGWEEIGRTYYNANVIDHVRKKNIGKPQWADKIVYPGVRNIIFLHAATYERDFYSPAKTVNVHGRDVYFRSKYSNEYYQTIFEEKPPVGQNKRYPGKGYVDMQIWD